MENRKLIYVYTSTGQLVNSTPFIGIEKALEFLVKKAEIEFDVTEKEITIWRDALIDRCRTNGDIYAGYYFRSCPTTVFKTAQKFKTIKHY
jgi:hypothetical protein